MRKKKEKEAESDRKLAALLDHASQSSAPIPSAPDHEFEAILEEMKRRGIEPRITKELKEQK